MSTCRNDVDTFTWGRIVLSSPKRAHVDWNWPISRERYLKIDWSVKMPLHWLIRDFKIHYGELLLRLLRPWGTMLTTPFPLQTSNRLRFRCTATGCSAFMCLYKNGYVRLYSTFIRQRLDQWQWFPSLVSILRLPEIRFASQLLLQRPASAATWIFQPQNKITLMKSSISARVGCS